MSLDTVLSNLKTLLETITTANGYANNVGDVVNDIIFVEGANYFAISIIVPESTLVDKSGFYVDRFDDVFLYILVKNETAPMAAMLSASNDVLKCLATDRQLSGACKYFKPVKARIAYEWFKDGIIPGIKPPYGAYVIECKGLHQYYQPSGA